MADATTPASVYLVGAGPGDPGLATVRAVELIEQADVVVYDYLSNGALLAHTRPDARLEYVGKKGFSHHVTQEQINDLLVECAQADGVRSVVRLKGGDPFVFGRGGEEALVLRERGIPFEVVPGVTSAIAASAYAGIPVTQRKVASSVTLITGHEDPTRETSSIDWRALAALIAQGNTVCFYMGVRSLSKISEQLKGCGADAGTPVALVRWGTCPAQETLVGMLGDIAEKARQAQFAAPAIIVVGQVVALRDELSWFEERPLFGKRIVVTRSRSQASVLVERLEELGAETLEVPTIEFAAPDDAAPLERAAREVGGYDWVVFTSVNGVAAFFDALSEQGRDARAFGGCRIAAIGPATASALEAHGITADLVPSEYKAEGVFAALQAQAPSLEGARVLIPRAQVARETLPELLEKAGASVDIVAAYKTVLAAGERAAELREQLLSGRIDAVTFTSSSTARNLVALLGEDAEEALARTGLVSIGPITTQTLEKAGLQVAAQAQTYTIPGLVQALCEMFTRERNN